MGNTASSESFVQVLTDHLTKSYSSPSLDHDTLARTISQQFGEQHQKVYECVQNTLGSYVTRDDVRRYRTEVERLSTVVDALKESLDNQREDGIECTKAIESVVEVTSWYTDDQMSTGSGFVVSADGLVVTAGHNIRMEMENATEILVTLCGTTHPLAANIVAIDGRADIALIRLRNVGRQLRPLEFETDHLPRSGDRVVVIGNAHGRDPASCSVGYVRNPSWKDPTSQSLLSLLITNVPTARGCSGGPICNTSGRVVGMHLAAYETVRIAHQTGQAAPATTAAALTVDTSDTVATVLAEPATDDNPGTHFGGGLQADFIQSFLQLVEVGSRVKPDSKLTMKHVLQCSFLPNTLDNRIKLNKFDETLMPSEQVSSYIGGFIVVELDNNETSELDNNETSGLKPGDVITHVNGKPVGYLAHESTVCDATWFLDEPTVQLTLVKQDGTHHLDKHETMTLPVDLDVPPGSAQRTTLFYIFDYIRGVIRRNKKKP